jgi:Amt family ammonium transporter
MTLMSVRKIALIFVLGTMLQAGLLATVTWADPATPGIAVSQAQSETIPPPEGSPVAAASAPAPLPTKQDVAMDTIWVIVAAVLVMFMQAGFAMLECGFSRAKNAGHTAMKNLLVFAVSSLVFWAVGFAVCFGTGNALVGTSGWFLSVAADKVNEVFASLSFSSVPVGAKYLFEVVFCAVSLAIVWGGMAERTKLIVYLVFGAIFSAAIYPVVGHWIWGGGWLSGLGMQDFAGSTVVHLQGASAALAGAILLGPRIGKFTKSGKANALLGHNIPFVILGTIILWFGWFGFNPGSTLSALNPEPGYFAYIALTTNLAAAAGVLAGLLVAWWVIGNPDMTMAANGALAALVAITASCAFVDPWAAVVIGAGAGTIAVLGVMAIDRLKIDDPVGAVSVHGMAGIWGTLANGLFATPERVKLLAVGQPGLVYGGGFHQLMVQLAGVLASFAYVFVASMVVFYALKLTIGLRVSAEEELEGLDLSEHGILGYPEHPQQGVAVPVHARTAPQQA